MISAKIELYKGDITKLNVDAIVNAANSRLSGGGGVDGAIHRAAGPGLIKACVLLNGCDTGDAKITDAYNLAAKFVIHTVGPIWSNGKRNDSELLSSSYKRSLELAVENHIKTIAFPNISTGVYAYPKQEAAEIAIKTVSNFLSKHPSIEKVFFVTFDEDNFQIYSGLLKTKTEE